MTTSTMSDAIMYRILWLKNQLTRDEEGQDLVEYALLVAFIALVALVGVTLAGQAISSLFSSVASRLNAIVV